MLRNPIDAGPVTAQDGVDFLLGIGNTKPMDALRERATAEIGGGWKRLRDVLRAWPDLDLVVFQHGFDIAPIPVDEYVVAGSAGPMILATRHFDQPTAVVIHSITNDASWRASTGLRALCADLGLPLFLSMRGAATAIKRLIDFHRAHPHWRPSHRTTTDIPAKRVEQAGADSGWRAASAPPGSSSGIKDAGSSSQ
jgi:hypothetical protein